MAKRQTLVPMLSALFALLLGCHGTQYMRPEQQPSILDQLKGCALTRLGLTSTALEQETLSHLVNGGVFVVSTDSLHRILQNNSYPVAAVTHEVIDSVTNDTTITIYLSFPRKDWFNHELANALVMRHRALLLGAEPKAETSQFYQRCVPWCPQCSAGAY